MILASTLIKQYIDENLWTAHRDGAIIKSKDLIFGEHSVDVSLANKTIRIRPRNRVIDPYDADSLDIYEEEFETLTLNHLDFVLTYVRERFNCSRPIWDEPSKRFSHYTQIYDGHSSMGRLGITSHQTAGYCDYGFDGNITLELYNHNPHPVKLHVGMRIGHVTFLAVHGISDEDYSKRGFYASNQYDRPREPILGRRHFE